jgi:tight adherence protein B
VLDDVAGHLRADQRARGEIRAQVAQATTSAALLVCLPVLSAAISAIVDPTVLSVLFSTPAGVVCLVVGIVGEVAGALWMLALVRGVR